MQTENSKCSISLIEYIRDAIIINYWEKEEDGNVIEFDNDFLSQFATLSQDDRIKRGIENNPRNLPFLLYGFLAYLVRYWKADTHSIYSGYLETSFYQYQEEYNNDADVLKRDLKGEFYKLHRAQEEICLKKSKPFFDLISDQEVAEIKEYVKYYFDYFDEVSKLYVTKEDQPANQVVPPESEGITPSKPGYKLDIVRVNAVYEFCVESNVLDEGVISNVDFINAVYRADFKAILDHAEEQKSVSKCKYIIYLLSKIINDSAWYINAAHSINTEPVKCSGANAPSDWKRMANGMRFKI